MTKDNDVKSAFAVKTQLQEWNLQILPNCFKSQALGNKTNVNFCDAVVVVVARFCCLLFVAPRFDLSLLGLATAVIRRMTRGNGP